MRCAMHSGRHRDRQAWRHFAARGSLRALSDAAAIDEGEITDAFQKASARLTSSMNAADLMRG